MLCLPHPLTPEALEELNRLLRVDLAAPAPVLEPLAVPANEAHFFGPIEKHQP